MPGQHAGGRRGGCGRRLRAERQLPRLWSFAQHPVRAGGQGEPSRGDLARGHPAIAPAAAVLTEGAGLAALRPRDARCQLAVKAAPSGHAGGSPVRAGASRGCSVGEPGPLRAVARTHRAPERVLASGCEVGRGLAMVYANGGGPRAATVQLGTGG